MNERIIKEQVQLARNAARNARHASAKTAENLDKLSLKDHPEEAIERARAIARACKTPRWRF